MHRLRTRTSPGLGSGTSTVAKEKLSGVGTPWGRLAKRISRLVVGMVPRCWRVAAWTVNLRHRLQRHSNFKCEMAISRQPFGDAGTRFNGVGRIALTPLLLQSHQQKYSSFQQRPSSRAAIPLAIALLRITTVTSPLKFVLLLDFGESPPAF